MYVAPGMGIDQPLHSVGGMRSALAQQVFYSYLFRPKYKVRQEIERRMGVFDIEKDTCAVMHVRRGDVVMHRSGGRAYLSIEAYVRAGRGMMDALGVRTVLLFTDSQGAIDEALRCEKDFPDVCKGVKWRFIDKKRWVGAEGGWENPFPSGNATEELLIVLTEFALAQKCSMAILGNSGYGEMIYKHMCCSFPLPGRGVLPSRCVCPPRVELEQSGFNCNTGNKILCNKQDVGGNIMLSLNEPSNMLGANYSLTKDAYRDNPTVRLKIPGENNAVSYMMKNQKLTTVKNKVDAAIVKAKELVCAHRNNGDKPLSFCKGNKPI